MIAVHVPSESEAPRPKPDSERLVCRCPVCGFKGEPDDFDVLGADEDCMFCLECGAEIATDFYCPLEDAEGT